MLAAPDAPVVEVPQLGPLRARVPLAEVVAEREDPLLGAGALLVAARAAERGVEAAVLDRVEQRDGLQPVARRAGLGRIPLLARAAGGDRVLDPGGDQALAQLADAALDVLEHLGEVVARVDVQHGEREAAGAEGLLGETEKDDRVLAAREHEHGPLELGRDLAEHVDGFGLERVEMVGGAHGSHEGSEAPGKLHSPCRECANCRTSSSCTRTTPAASCSPTAIRCRRRTSSAWPTRGSCSGRPTPPRRRARPAASALLTGRWPHANGMLGLAHRGFALEDPGQHLLHTLRAAGYWTAMVGEQHVSADPEDLGYDFVADAHTSQAQHVAPGDRGAAARPAAAPVLPLGRVLRDPPRLLRADLGARRALLDPAGEPARLAGHAARHGLVQAERAVARPRRRRGARARSTSRTSPTRRS